MGKTKQKSRAAKKVAVFFIVFIIIEMLIVGSVAYVFRNDDVTPSFGGFSLFLMDSDNIDSIPKDALIVVENGSPSKEKISSAVLCENVPDVGSTILWLSDVTSKDNVDGVIYVVYQDDGTTYELKSADVIGVAPTYYITAGKVIRFISTPIGIAACAAAPVALWLVIEIIVVIATHSGKKKGSSKTENEADEEISLDDVLYRKDDATPLKFDKEKNVEREIEDISFVNEDAEAENENEAADETEVTDETNENADDQQVEEAENEQPERIIDVDETVSTTRKAASDSLEELMKMMEEEQKKLKEQLSKN